MRLVVAEDSLLVREGLPRLLGHLGHDIVGVAARAKQILTMATRCLMCECNSRSPMRCKAGSRDPRAAADVAVLVLSQNVESKVAEVLLDGGG